MENKIKILLVDDEEDILEFLTYNLESEGFEVIQACDGIEALEKLIHKPDVILLDISMPKMDGFEVCSHLRQNPSFSDVPIIFLTARTSEINELKGLNMGANDYVKKPISPKLLLARIKANLRAFPRYSDERKAKNQILFGPLNINRENFTVAIDGVSQFFPKKEFEILFLLSSNPGKVFSRQEILANIWGDEVFVIDRTIDVHIRKIREKLGKYGEFLETIKGIGYKFKEVD